MKEPIKGYCNMCLQGNEVRNVGLFTNGSEGTNLCHDCEMRVVDFIRMNGREAVVQRIARFRKERKDGKHPTRPTKLDSSYRSIRGPLAFYQLI